MSKKQFSLDYYGGILETGLPVHLIAGSGGSGVATPSLHLPSLSLSLSIPRAITLPPLYIACFIFSHRWGPPPGRGGIGHRHIVFYIEVLIAIQFRFSLIKPCFSIQSFFFFFVIFYSTFFLSCHKDIQSCQNICLRRFQILFIGPFSIKALAAPKKRRSERNCQFRDSLLRLSGQTMKQPIFYFNHNFFFRS